MAKKETAKRAPAKKAPAKKAVAKKAAGRKTAASAKTSSKADDFRAQSGDELADRLTGLKKEQFNLRFQQANGQLENTGRIRILRRDIARIQTVLAEQHARAAEG